ncbi:hypothetical protein LTR97_011730 [Elasticomyces elasticus]|uniref:proline--tRNA ligase n=1 Tax=Elasticomyces elasticus TaxID=574655 RepID=A0AAN7VL82_9PEZI|nr:hypothetical protein LTR97_011730 [Elasticomyces elasticus]
MLYSNGLKQGSGAFIRSHVSASTWTRRLHYDGRNRLSNIWTPTQSKKPAETSPEDGHDLLIRAGFMRQAHSGIFHLLPLGLRVQEKIERLIDKHMLSLGASKVSLSSLTSEGLWQRSGRLEKGRGSEFFRLEDRKGTKLLLSPTHEEEITTIVANAVHSHKQLPLRLYQVSRKYRDEARPRQGLLRGREFVMKDLYTFDSTEQSARATYETVRQAYSAFLNELRLPYLVATADSGKMGGNLSHEYHFASQAGEDTVIKCNKCDYSVNEEMYAGLAQSSPELESPEDKNWTFMVSKDHRTLLIMSCERGRDINVHAVKSVFPDVDTSVEDPVEVWKAEHPDAVDQGTDPRMMWLASASAYADWCHLDMSTGEPLDHPDYLVTGAEIKQGLAIINALQGVGLFPVEDFAITQLGNLDLTKARNEDRCPNCSSGHLTLHKAVEIGHTFHLGTRYSEPLDLRVTDASNTQKLVHMGCHGIGVSRLIGAAASLLADQKGLNWPVAIAPYTVVLVAAGKTRVDDVGSVYDTLQRSGSLDAVIDDRTDYPTGWKLHDADLIGYPFIVVLGKAWAERGAVELQCRRLGVKEEARVEDLAVRVAEMSARL